MFKYYYYRLEVESFFDDTLQKPLTSEEGIALIQLHANDRFYFVMDNIEEAHFFYGQGFYRLVRVCFFSRVLAFYMTYLMGKSWSRINPSNPGYNCFT